jgi:hypothetical protein
MSPREVDANGRSEGGAGEVNGIEIVANQQKAVAHLALSSYRPTCQDRRSTYRKKIPSGPIHLVLRIFRVRGLF